MTRRERRLQSQRKIVIREKKRRWKSEAAYYRKGPDRRKSYPSNWQSEIVPRILARDGYRCRECGVERYAVGEWDREGKFTQWRQSISYKEGKRIAALISVTLQRKQVVVTLACAHLENPDPMDVRDSNLAAMCNYHHAVFDKGLRIRGHQRWWEGERARREEEHKRWLETVTEPWGGI